MKAVILQPRRQQWECPNCDVTSVSQDSRPHSQMHPCRGLKGLIAPLVPAGTKCKVVAVEREDYVKRELVQTDGEGRPIMAIVTVRDNGQDCVALAPTAQSTSQVVA